MTLIAKKLKTVFAIALSTGLLLGCEQKGKITRTKKKLIAQNEKTEALPGQPGSNQDIPNSDTPALPRIAINEDSAALPIPVKVTGIATTATTACDSTYLSYTSSNPSLISSLGAATWSGTWPDCSVSFAPVANVSGSSDIQITATNGTDSVIINTFKLEVVAVNDAPTDITLGSTSIPENAGPNAVVSVLASTDSDSGDTFTYSLVPGTGDTDNGSFNINSGSLRLNDSADFEVKTSYSLRLRTTDAAGLTFDKAFTITVTNVNDAPTIADIANQSTNEDTTLTGLAVAIADPDGALVCSTALAATSSNASLIANGNLVVTGIYPNCLLSMTPASNQNGTSTITLTVSDGTLNASDTFVLTVNPVNDTPSVSVAGDASKITSLNTPVSITLSNGADPDVASNGQTLSYLVSTAPTNGALSSWAANAVAGGTVTYTPNNLYSGADSFSYQICDNHSTPLCSGAISVSLTILNGTPTNISLSAASIAENAGTNAVVGALTTTDPDTGDTFTYSLIAGTGDTDNASFNINSGNLSLTASGDFEVKTSYAVRLRTTDAGGLTFDKAFIVAITNVNETPTDITLSSSSIAENSGTNAVIGTMSSIDTDAGDTFTYSLVAGVGDADNGSFNINSGNLRLTSSANYEIKNSFAVRLRTTDSGGLTFDKAFTVTITDIVEPLGWYPEAYVKPANTEAADGFGGSVSISGDTLAIGALNEDENSTVIVNGITAPNTNGSLDSGAVYVYKRTGTAWAQESYIKAVNAETGDRFGRSVSISGNILAVGADNEDENSTVIVNGTTAPNANGASGSGAVYVYKRTGASWAQEAYIKAANAQATDIFGTSVSLSGDTLAASAVWEDENSTVIINGTSAPNANGAADSGSIYVYRRSSSTWAQEAYIKAVNASAGDYAGYGLAISGDTLTVGLYAEDENSTVIVNGTTAPNANGASDSGAVYVYRRTGSSWSQEAYIKAANAAADDNFGGSVSLSGDFLTVGVSGEDENSTVIVNGTTAPDANGASDSGAVYVYKRTGTSWAQEAYIKASNASAIDYFGLTRLSGDTLCVGASSEDENNTTIVNGTTAPNANGATDSGSVYVYKRTGSSWAQEAYIKAANAQAGDYFSYDVSISGDTLTVGALLEDENSTVIVNGTTAPNANGAADSGAVYVYRNTSRLFEPIEVLAQSATTDSFTTSWIDQNRGSGSGTYKVVYGTSEPNATCSNGTVAHEGPGTSATVSSGLTPGQTYYVRVCQTDGASWTQGTLIRVTVKGTNEVPTILSINRGAAANPVEPASAPAALDFVVTFSQPMIGLSAENFTLSEIGSSKGATGTITSIDCSVGSLCRVWVRQGNVGNLRLDLTSSIGIKDIWGNGLATTRNGDQSYELKGWHTESYIKAANAEASDSFGHSVSLSGDTLAIGARQEDENSTVILNSSTASNTNGAVGSGAVYVYKRTGTSWVQEAYIKASNAEAGDQFGESVNLSGDTLTVGAILEDENSTVIVNGTTAPNSNTAADSGAVYIYRRSGSTWAQEAYIKASNASGGDNFGYSLSLSGDTLSVGATGEDENSTTIVNGTTAPNANGAAESGAIYVYRRSGSTWAQEAYIKAANTAATDYFGASVSLSGDTLTVGAHYEDKNSTVIVNGTTAPTANGKSQSGAVYVYRRTGSTWAREAYIKAVNSAANNYFGGSVSLSGNTLAVGTPGEDENGTVIVNGTTAPNLNLSIDRGAAYVYRRSGVTWSQEAYIKTSNSSPSDFMGYSVSLSGDTLIAGANYEDENSTVIMNGAASLNANGAADSGAVYVFRRSGSTWAHDAYIKAANAQTIDLFGDTVSLSGDSLTVGAKQEDENSTVIVNGTTAPNANGATDSGAVYVYRNNTRLFDPDIRVNGATSTSISFAWADNLGTSNQVIVAPTVSGTGTPATCQLAGGGGSLTLGAGVTTYTYSGLTTGTRYGFRFCSTDGSLISGGTMVWFDTP